MFDLFVRFPYLAAVVSFLVGLILMPFVLQFAKSRNMVVRPNKRTSHQGAVPNIGGVNIFLSLLVVFIPLVVSGNMKPSLFVGFCIIFVIGFRRPSGSLCILEDSGRDSLCLFSHIFRRYSYHIAFGYSGYIRASSVIELCPVVSVLYSCDKCPQPYRWSRRARLGAWHIVLSVFQFMVSVYADVFVFDYRFCRSRSPYRIFPLQCFRQK